MTVVQLIDQIDKTPRGVFVAFIEIRHIRQQNGMEVTGDFDVVGAGSRALAQGIECEPGHARTQRKHGNVALVDFDETRQRRASAQPPVLLGQQRPAVGIGRQRIGPRLAQCPQPVILRALQLHHRTLALQQGDAGQEALALQTVRIKFIRRHVGGCDECHLSSYQLIEQAVEDHGIADIGNEKLIQNQQPAFACEPVGQDRQCVGGVRHAGQLVMDMIHEAVEMPALMRNIAQIIQEQFGQQGLAATDAAPEIEALDRYRPAEITLPPGPLLYLTQAFGQPL